jgi:hypothetical protein
MYVLTEQSLLRVKAFHSNILGLTCFGSWEKLVIFYLTFNNMTKLFTTPWCKDCWFLDDTRNLVRCEYHQALWSSRYRSTHLPIIKRKKKYYIKTIIQEEDDEVDKESIQE